MESTATREQIYKDTKKDQLNDSSEESASTSSNSTSSINSLESHSDSTVSESCGKPPPPVYDPTRKILEANERLNKVSNILEKSSRITFSETVSQKSISFSDEEYLDDEGSKSSSKSSEKKPEEKDKNNSSLNSSNSNTNSTESPNTNFERKGSDSNTKMGEISEQAEAAVLPPSVNTSVNVSSSKKSHSEKSSKSVKSQSQKSSKKPGKKMMPGSKSSNSNYADDFDNSQSISVLSEDERTFGRAPSVKFSDTLESHDLNRSYTRPKSSLSHISNVSNASDIKSTRASRLLAESISSRPSSAPIKKQKKAQLLWTGEPPEVPEKLPNYMRPQTGDSKVRRKASGAPRSAYGIDMKKHYENLNKEFPNIKSDYEMPKG